ncbi:hypothetical protein EYF80_012239 [Liparis tanakae]|uniref:Uncharacterized protein n=1 Tax=Liparis tanakae TaxID=230148 RepID=A0A4Z2II09_9TELE|nr:hypothetical protein EYF80_012239 [Liparis tanakae]
MTNSLGFHLDTPRPRLSITQLILAPGPQKLDVSDTVLETLRDDDPLEVRSTEELCGPAPTTAPPGRGAAITLTLGCCTSSPTWRTVDTVVSIRLAL